MFASRLGKVRASFDVNSFPSNSHASDWLPPNLLLIRRQNAPPKFKSGYFNYGVT